MKLKSVLMALVLFSLSVPMPAQSRISGQVYRADGSIPVVANVLLTKINGSPGYNVLQTIPVSPEGTFSLTVEKPGLYRVWVCMPKHFAKSIPMVVKENEEIHLELTAAPHSWKESIEKVEIIGSWNGYDPQKPEPMTRQEDGTFVYTHKTDQDTIGYQLMGLATLGGRTVSGTMADFYEYDGHGAYRSMLRVRGDSVRIIFDPSKLLRVAPEADVPKVTFDAEHKNLEKLFALTLARNKNLKALNAAHQKYVEEHGNSEGFSFYDSSYVAFLEEKVFRSEDEDERQMAAGYLLGPLLRATESKNDVVEKIMDVVPPDSPWLASGGQMVTIFAMVGPKEKTEEYLKQVLENNPEKSVRAQVVAFFVQRYAKTDEEKFKHYFGILKNEYGDESSVQFTLKRYDPDRAIKVGKPVPDFEVTLMDSEEKVSKSSMMGKTYLMDFWAVWCGPCIAEMPALHAAYEKFHDKGLEILSLSFDIKEDDVREFRAEKWKMPWLHTFVEKGFANELARRFEVYGIPKPILVGPDGTILAVEEELRGEELEKTLTRFLGEVSEK